MRSDIEEIFKSIDDEARRITRRIEKERRDELIRRLSRMIGTIMILIAFFLIVIERIEQFKAGLN